MPWSETGKFVDVSAPPVPEDALILMTGFAPTSFVIPAFPASVSFLRPQSYLVEPTHATRFTETLRARIAAHGGPLYLLQPIWERHAGRAVLPQFGLAPTADCRPVPNNLDDELELCAVERVAGP